MQENYCEFPVQPGLHSEFQVSLGYNMRRQKECGREEEREEDREVDRL